MKIRLALGALGFVVAFVLGALNTGWTWGLVTLVAVGVGILVAVLAPYALDIAGIDIDPDDFNG